MPVTAKLSKRFYDALGEQVANELVDWFNSVDANYRADLRELNELNFARFDAKLEQRIVETNARMDKGFAECNARMDVGFARVDHKLADLGAELLKWMFLFWVTGIGVNVWPK